MFDFQAMGAVLFFMAPILIFGGVFYFGASTSSVVQIRHMEKTAQVKVYDKQFIPASNSHFGETIPNRWELVLDNGKGRLLTVEVWREFYQQVAVGQNLTAEAVCAGLRP